MHVSPMDRCGFGAYQTGPLRGAMDLSREKLEAPPALEIEGPDKEEETDSRKMHLSYQGNYRLEVLRNGVKRKKPTKVPQE